MKKLILALSLILALFVQAAPVDARDRGTGAGTEGTLSALSVYQTTMSTSNTAAQNDTAFQSDVEAAITAGKKVHIPAGTYKWGTGTQNSISVTGTQKAVIDCDIGAVFDVQSGATTIPFIFTTKSGWVDYTPTAIATATSGGNIATNAEVTKLTFASAPTVAVGDLVSVVSTDLLAHEVTAYERNFSQEMAYVLSISGNDVYLDRKLVRTYTVTNYVRMVDYNNRNAVFNMSKNCEFQADGDIDSAATRPTNIFEVRGFRNPYIGYHLDEAWAGGVRVNATSDSIVEMTSTRSLNGISATSVLGYLIDFDGINLNPLVNGGAFKEGRHITTTWSEETSVTITGGTSGATTVFNYSATDPTPSSADQPDAGDWVYISGVVGITECNNTWKEVTTSTGDENSGTFTIACASTGTWTSGGTADLFQPDQKHRYGDVQGMMMTDVTMSSARGDGFDVHGNAYNFRINGGGLDYSNSYSWSTTAGKGLQDRGWNTVVNDWHCTYCNTAINISEAFNQPHGNENPATGAAVAVRNTPIYTNILLDGQANMASTNALIEINGSASVTDARTVYLNQLNVRNAYRVMQHDADSGDVVINMMAYTGDWGVASPSHAMFRNSGGSQIIMNGIIDLSLDSTATNQHRIGVNIAGTQHWKNMYFRNFFNNTTSNPFQCDGGTLIFEDSTFEYSSSLASNAGRGIVVNNAACTVIFRGKNKIVNASKVSSSRGFVASSGASGAATIYIDGEIVSDAAFTMAASVSSGVYTITKRDAGHMNTIVKNSVGTTAVGNVGTGEDNLITATLPATTLYKAGKGVRITAYGTTANNANAKTLKCYFGSQLIFTNALTASIAGVWSYDGMVWATGTDTQDWYSRLITTGAAGVAANDIESGTATQDDGADVTIKCTGEATSNNDIVMEMLSVEAL